MEKSNPQEKIYYMKVSLLFLILFFWVTGVAVICVGASVQLKLSDISVFLVEASSGAPLVITVIGIIVFFVSGFGAIAVLKENSTLIKSFTAIMFVIFIIEVIVGISAYSYREKLQSDLSWRFRQVLNNYGIEEPVTRMVDRIQQEFQCCGAQNFTDWLNITSVISPLSVPKSCCKKVSQKCGDNVLAHTEAIYTEGCATKMRGWIAHHINVIGAVGVGLGFVQIIGILLSFYLVKILQENYVSL